MNNSLTHQFGEIYFSFGLFILLSIAPSSLLSEVLKPYCFPAAIVLVALGLFLASFSKYAVLYRSFDDVNREAFMVGKVAPLLSQSRRVVILKNPKAALKIRRSPMSLVGSISGALAMLLGDYFNGEPSLVKVVLIIFLTFLAFELTFFQMHLLRVFDRMIHKDAERRLFKELGTFQTLRRRYIPRWPRMIIEIKAANHDWFWAALICASRSDFVVFDVSSLRRNTALERELKCFTQLCEVGQGRTIVLIWREYNKVSADALESLGINVANVISDEDIELLSVLGSGPIDPARSA